MITMTPSILIVDDHPSFRAMARALLQSEGYTIVGEAVDGASALTAVRELHPEVVLLDVQLPDTDGFAVASGADPRARPAGDRAHLQPRRQRLRAADRGERCARLRPQG